MRLAYKKENALNAICPYFTMFPLEYPSKILLKYRKEKPIVFDPFCGRGTTLFAARKLGLVAWGCDSSPVAAAVARAKLASCTINEPLELAQKILLESTPKEIPKTDFFDMAFHPGTLKQICALREGLRNRLDDNAGTILRAAILGCLHGPLPKHIENAGYFSNQMPRTYASKPDYAVRFWQKRSLYPPFIDVLPVLKKKISRLCDLEDSGGNDFSQVILGDSQKRETIEIIKRKIDLVITSPPYYGMRSYVQDQWLRNWFLGGPDQVEYTNDKQLEHSGQDVFAKSLGRVWKNIGSQSGDNLRLYVRFGIIPSVHVDAKKLFLASLETSGIEWKIISIRKAASSENGKRQATQMKAKSAAALEYDFHIVKV